ncbi:MAG: ATP-binding protein [Spirochaetes bacterium]|nr:ATP-binding protein [Spirochaetota bacterium]
MSDRNDRTLPLQVLDALHEGVIVVDARRAIILMNPRAEQLLGRRWSPSVALADLFPDAAARAALEAAIAAGRATSQAFCHKLGEVVLEVGVSPFTGGGTGLGAVILLSDITETWKTEQERLRFVSMVVHELKSPLSAILNYINVILTGMFDTDPKRVREMLERCKIRGEALLDLVRDLLYINRREVEPVRKDAEDFDLCTVLGEQVDFFTVQTERHRIRVTVRCDAPRAMVRADRADLDRVFMNLLSNSIKYNRDGGAIDVRVSDADDGWAVAISDTGIGMSTAESEGLFREFYRVKNERTAGIPGTGLGLVTVKRVLSDYGAKIAFSSKPGKGSTFTVTFPKAP